MFRPLLASTAIYQNIINLCLDSLNNEIDVQYGEWKELMNIILHRNYYSAKYSKNKKGGHHFLVYSSNK